MIFQVYEYFQVINFKQIGSAPICSETLVKICDFLAVTIHLKSVKTPDQNIANINLLWFLAFGVSTKIIILVLNFLCSPFAGFCIYIQLHVGLLHPALIIHHRAQRQIAREYAFATSSAHLNFL